MSEDKQHTENLGSSGGSSDLDARMGSDGWVKIAPGMYQPGPEIKSKRRRIVSEDEIKAFIRKYADSIELAEELIEEIYGR